MGKTLVSLVMDALAQSGIPVMHAYPGRCMDIPAELTAAVQLESLDQEQGTVTVLVSAVVPAKAGAEACEDGGLKICRCLQNMGGVCRQKCSEYQKDGDIFITQVFGTFAGQETDQGWQEAEPPAPEPEKETFWVFTNGALRAYVSRVNISHAFRGDAPEDGNRPWSFELEEVYPLEVAENELPGDGFLLETVRKGRTEHLTDCVLLERVRQLREDGQHQILKGVAATLEKG